MTLKKKAFENIVRKEENAGNEYFLTMFSSFYTKILSVVHYVTLSHTSPRFFVSAVQVLWKHSFSHIVFYQFGKLSAIFIKFKIVVCKFLEFGSV